ncbi:conserved hypothetical protein [Vibrio harveyi]|nr:conserved hypothetical protein [Vibrio harveyi]SQA27613.1 Uncharacterised protein [Vibrio harveyi]
MCNHGVYLQRQQRSWFQKLIGIKEVYVCSKCGHEIKLR